MRTGALKYLCWGFLILMTDFKFGRIDWTPDLIGALVAWAGIRELRVFDGEAKTRFGASVPWLAALSLLAAAETVWPFCPLPASAGRWIEAAAFLCASAVIYRSGADVFRLSLAAGQTELAARLRRSVLIARVCCITLAFCRLLSALSAVPSLEASAWTVAAISAVCAVWLASDLLRAQKQLKPFWG